MYKASATESMNMPLVTSFGDSWLLDEEDLLGSVQSSRSWE
jgi:hypothetical protein